MLRGWSYPLQVAFFLVSARVRHATVDVEWSLTSVYEPVKAEEKDAFLQELTELCRVRTGPWLLIGNFNMIYRAQDKNNTRLN
jgi:hypothetical protein